MVEKSIKTVPDRADTRHCEVGAAARIFHAHSTAAGLLIGTRVVTSPAGFKGESPGPLGSAGALEAGGEVGGTVRLAGPEGRRGRAVDGGKGAERAVPRRPRCGAWGAGVSDPRKAGTGGSRGVGEGVSA